MVIQRPKNELQVCMSTVIKTTIEHGGSILANSTANQSLSSGVVHDKFTHVVHDTRNSDQRTSIHGLFFKVIPLDQWQLLKRPLDLSVVPIEVLLLLLKFADFDLILAELFEVIGESYLLPEPDGPLGRIELIPGDGVAIVRGKLVVEIMVTLTSGDKSSEYVISRRVSIVKCLIS